MLGLKGCEKEEGREDGAASFGLDNRCLSVRKVKETSAAKGPFFTRGAQEGDAPHTVPHQMQLVTASKYAQQSEGVAEEIPQFNFSKSLSILTWWLRSRYFLIPLKGNPELFPGRLAGELASW